MWHFIKHLKKICVFFILTCYSTNVFSLNDLSEYEYRPLPRPSSKSEHIKAFGKESLRLSLQLLLSLTVSSVEIVTTVLIKNRGYNTNSFLKIYRGARQDSNTNITDFFLQLMNKFLFNDINISKKDAFLESRGSILTGALPIFCILDLYFLFNDMIISLLTERESAYSSDNISDDSNHYTPFIPQLKYWPIIRINFDVLTIATTCSSIMPWPLTACLLLSTILCEMYLFIDVIGTTSSIYIIPEAIDNYKEKINSLQQCMKSGQVIDPNNIFVKEFFNNLKIMIEDLKRFVRIIDANIYFTEDSQIRMHNLRIFVQSIIDQGEHLLTEIGCS